MVATAAPPTIAHAQISSTAPIGGVSAVDPNDPVERLGSYIRTLSTSPRDLSALLGAGRAALEVGDANAALGFYARAEDASPRSWEAKAGLASSLTMIERPDDALRLFGEAVTLGARETVIAKDRGLAYDLRGDSRRAQRDYALALTQGPDDEVSRRYALSLGISGDRAAAMVMLDPLVRKQDRAAWRARAFVLAMNGDVPGANELTRSLMPAQMAASMAPMLGRLGRLNAAERAHAVNFGSMPSDGTRLAAVQTGDPFAGRASLLGAPASPSITNPSSGLIPSGQPLGVRTATVAPITPPSMPIRSAPAGASVLALPTPMISARPSTLGRSTLRASPSSAAPGFSNTDDDSAETSRRIGNRIGDRVGTPIANRVALVPEQPAGTTALARRTPLPPSLGTATVLAQPPKPASVPMPSSLSASTKIAALPPPPLVSPDASVSIPVVAAPSSQPLSVAGPPGPSGVVPVAAPPASKPPAAPGSRLANLLSGIALEQESKGIELPTGRELRLAQAAAKRKLAQLEAAQAAERAAKAAAAEEAAKAKKFPARVWVQVATGSMGGMPITWRRIQSGNEKALKGQSAWTAPYKASTRLLVGPMKSAAAARDLVASLDKNGLDANVYSSEAGEEVAKLGGK